MLNDPVGLIGSTIAEKYAIESVVGSGGFATVYRANHLVWKRPVAVKVFRALGDVEPERRKALLDDFIQEGALLAELSEKTTAICQARDIGMLLTPAKQLVPYMVLEWLEGKPLDVVLETELFTSMPLRTLEETVRLLDPIAEALALAHGRGIAHRDVKPENIFVLGEPRAQSPSVKLLDFGIAKVAQDVEKMGLRSTSGAVTSFTPLYAAPEQFNRDHGATGPWTDVFALALVTGQVLSGRTPMNGDSVVELSVISSDRTKRPTPRTLGVATSDEIERVFAKALAVTPTDRWATAGDFWGALRREVLGESRRLPKPPPSRPSREMVVPDLDLAPRSRPSAQMPAARPSAQMPAARVPDLAPASRPSAQMAAVRPSAQMAAARPSSGAMPAVRPSTQMAAVRAPVTVDANVDDFDMEIERGDMRSMPQSDMGMHAAPRSVRNPVPIASTGLGLSAQPSNRMDRERDDGEGRAGTGLQVAAWAVAVIVMSGTAAGLTKAARAQAIHPTALLPHAFDGSSAVQSGVISIASLVVAIALGFLGVKGTPRSWALVGGAAAMMLTALAMVTVTLGSTGEITTPPDGVLLLPYLLPVAMLGVALGIAARSAWLFMHRVVARKVAAIPVAAIAGVAAWAAWAMSPLVR